MAEISEKRYSWRHEHAGSRTRACRESATRHPSLQFWLLRAGPRKPSAWRCHKTRLSNWILRTLKNTTKGTRLTWGPRPQRPSSTGSSRCTSARWARLYQLRTRRACRMLSKRIKHHQRADHPCRKPSAEMRAAASLGQHFPDHDAACRFREKGTTRTP